MEPPPPSPRAASASRAATVLRREVVLREGPGWALLAAAIGGLGVDAWDLQHPLDDAYISYRYAQNLVAGLGLVYNPGEHVEGFTNLLWTLLVAGGVALGLSAPGAGWLLGIASGALVLVATFALTRIWLPARRAALAGLAPWIVMATPAFPRWSISGLETPLFIATGTAALVAFARGRLGWTTGFVTLATLTRPDGVLLAGVLYGLHLLRRWRDGPSAWRAPLVYAAALAALTLFRLAYYGAPVPNTFYAKVGGIPMIFGLHHVRGFLSDGAGLLLLPAMLAIAREPTARAAALYAAAVAGYVVWIGGDVFAHRFLLPVLPALAALGVRGASDAADLARSVVSRGPGRAASGLSVATALRSAAGVAAACVAVACVPGAALRMALGEIPATPRQAVALLREPHRAQHLERTLKIDRGFEARGMRSARVLRERGEPLRLVAAGAIGAFGYFSRLPILDLYGLVDATIARTRGPDAERRAGWIPGHQRSNADYVMSRRPDYILMPPRLPEGRGRGLVPAHDALWDHPDLDRWYEWDEEVPAYRRRTSPLEMP